MGRRMWITLNARLRPLTVPPATRSPLQELLDATAPGSRVTGAYTPLTAEREPVVSDIDLDIEGDAREVLERVTAALEAAGAPKGSRARPDDGDPVTFDATEGLALYLNGTDLPDEVYATCASMNSSPRCWSALAPRAACSPAGKARGKPRCTCTARPPRAWTS
jgi:hypothetical protein